MADAQSTPSPPIFPDGMPTPRRYFAIAALCIGNLLAVIDAGIANVALPSIARALHVSSSDAVLVVTVYQLTLVMTLLPLSALGDRIGHGRVYQAGQLLFTVSSLACLFTNSLSTLLLARVFQSLGAGAVLSVSAAITRSIYPASQLGRGLGLNSLIVAIGMVLAPTLGGFILAFAPWQWVFIAAVPFGVISLLIGWRAMPRRRTTSAQFDIRGSMLGALTFGLMIVGLEGLAHGQSLPVSLAEMAIGVGLGAIFVRHELAIAQPVMPVELLQKPVFALSFMASFCAHIAQIAVMVSLPFRLQHSYGFNPAEVGIMLAPWPLVLVVVAPVSGFVSDKVPAALLGGIGMIVGALGLAALSFLPAHPDAFDIGWRMALSGLGFGMFFAPNARLLVSMAPRDRVAATGGMIGTVRLFAQTLGAAMVAGMLALGLGETGLTTLFAAGLVVVAAGLSLARLTQQRRMENAYSEVSDY